LEITVQYGVPEAIAAGRVAAITVGTSAPDWSVPDGIAAAVAAARDAEVAVVVVGTTARLESEGFETAPTSTCPARRMIWSAPSPPRTRATVVVVNAGAPVTMPWRDEVAAVLLSWFGGQEFGHALADVLLGRAEPGGRLPTTWPAAESRRPGVDHQAGGGGAAL